MQLSSIFCFVRCEWTLYEAPTYGMMTPDGEWTEDSLVYDLATGKADMAVGAISIMAERETVVDFTVPYYDLVGVAVVMKKMEAPTNLFNFMIVFENSVWFTIAGAWFVSSVVLWAFDRQESKCKYIITSNFFLFRYSPYSYQNNEEYYQDDDEQRYFHIREALWFCCCSITPQGGGEAPKSPAARFFAATWWMFSFIIITQYTANLAAFLTVTNLERPVNKFEDLTLQTLIEYSAVNGSLGARYFENMAYIEEQFYE